MKAYIVMIMGMKLPSFPTKGPASHVKIWNHPTENGCLEFQDCLRSFPGFLHAWKWVKKRSTQGVNVGHECFGDGLLDRWTSIFIQLF